MLGRKSGRKKLDDPAASCGAQLNLKPCVLRSLHKVIPRRLGSEIQVWESRGLVREKVQKIKTFMHGRIPNIFDQDHIYPIDFAGYMIGRCQDKAKPFIFIISRDEAARRTAQQEMTQKDGIMEHHPELHVCGAPYHLDYQGDRKLLGNIEVMEVTDDVHSDHAHRPAIDIFSSTSRPDLGRRLQAMSAEGAKRRAGTGGVLLEIDGAFFQLASGHILEKAETDTGSETDLEWTHDPIDWSDSEDEDEGDDETSQNQEDEDGPRMSWTPRINVPHEDSERGSSSSASSAEDWVDQDLRECSPSILLDSTDCTPQRTRPLLFPASPSESSPLRMSPACASFDGLDYLDRHDAFVARIDWGSYHSRRGDRPALDWLLIPVDASTLGHRYNQIHHVGKDGPSDLAIRHVAPPPDDEPMDIIAMTASSGAIRGCVRSSTTLEFRSGLNPQEVYSIHLETPMQYGDSGSAVFDAKTGNLVGIIVSGVPNTRDGCMIAAQEIFDDIKGLTGSLPRLVAPVVHPEPVILSPIPKRVIVAPDPEYTAATDPGRENEHVADFSFGCNQQAEFGPHLDFGMPGSETNTTVYSRASSPFSSGHQSVDHSTTPMSSCAGSPAPRLSDLLTLGRSLIKAPTPPSTAAGSAAGYCPPNSRYAQQSMDGNAAAHLGEQQMHESCPRCGRAFAGRSLFFTHLHSCSWEPQPLLASRSTTFPPLESHGAPPSQQVMSDPDHPPRRSYSKAASHHAFGRKRIFAGQEVETADPIVGSDESDGSGKGSEIRGANHKRFRDSLFQGLSEHGART